MEGLLVDDEIEKNGGAGSHGYSRLEDFERGIDQFDGGVGGNSSCLLEYFNSPSMIMNTLSLSPGSDAQREKPPACFLLLVDSSDFLSLLFSPR